MPDLRLVHDIFGHAQGFRNFTMPHTYTYTHIARLDMIVARERASHKNSKCPEGRFPLEFPKN